MKRKEKTVRMGRPPKTPEARKGRYLQVRVQQSEKESFDEAARLAGLPLSIWVRERLRLVARDELEGYGKKAGFLEE